MTDSIETSEREALAAVVVPAALPHETPSARAMFALAHPDVLHTPAEYRDIIRGLMVEQGQGVPA